MGEFQGSGVQLCLDVTIPGLRGSVLAGWRFPLFRVQQWDNNMKSQLIKLLYFLEERPVEIVTGADLSSGFALPVSLLGLLLSFLWAGSSVFLGNRLMFGAEDDPMGDTPPAPALLGAPAL